MFASRHFAARHFNARHFSAAVDANSIDVNTLFSRIGKLGHVLNTINGRRGGSAAGDIPVEVNDALAAYDGTPNFNREAVASLLNALTGMQGSMAGILSTVRDAARTDLINSFHADDPLEELTVEAALNALTRLLGTLYYVEPNTIGVTLTSTGNSGTGVIGVCVKDGLGRPLENLLAEGLHITVTGTSTAGSEQLRIRGEVAQHDKLHYEWPAGSGADATYVSVDAASTSKNKLTNGTFETFTVANTPDNWTIVTGSAGTHLFSEASVVYAGSKALRIAGDGSNLTQIKQNIVAKVAGRTVYMLNFWARMSAAPSQGVLVADLHDGTNVINDEQGVAQTLSVDLTTLGTTYTARQLDFRLVEPLPAAVWLRFRLSTAIENGKSLYLDHAAVAPMTQPGDPEDYTPFVCIFSGAVNWALDDGAGTKVLKITTTNSRGSQWQELLDRFYDTVDVSWLTPTSGVVLINDNLIG